MHGRGVPRKEVAREEEEATVGNPAVRERRSDRCRAEGSARGVRYLGHGNEGSVRTPRREDPILGLISYGVAAGLGNLP